MKQIHLVLLVMLVFASCNSDKKAVTTIESIREESGVNSYEANLACMNYIMQGGKNFEYSLELVDQLIVNRRFTEARYALDKLAERNEDYRIYYLKAVCFRNEYQFDEAARCISRALELEKLDKLYEEETNIIADRQAWRGIEEINQLIAKEGTTPELLMRRAEGLIIAGNYDAARFDIDSVIHSGALQGEAYRLKIISLVYLKEYHRADSVLTVAANLPKVGQEIDFTRISTALQGVLEARKLITSGDTSPETYLVWVRSLVRLTDYKEAERIVLQGLSIHPNHPNLNLAHLLVLIESEQLVKARKVLQILKEKGIEVPGGIEEYLGVS